MLDMTWRANIGVSITRNRNIDLSMTVNLVSVVATTVAVRVVESIIAISPNVSSGPSLWLCPPGTLTSTSPSMTPNGGVQSPV
jgi:hypothetical protein